MEKNDVPTNPQAITSTAADLPQTYNPSQAVQLNWSLSNNNQYQFAGVTSFKEGEPDMEDEYFRQLAPSARTFIVPANAVNDFGNETIYTLGIDQVNFKIENRISLMSVQSVTDAYPKHLSPQNRQALKILRLYLILSKSNTP